MVVIMQTFVFEQVNRSYRSEGIEYISINGERVSRCEYINAKLQMEFIETAENIQVIFGIGEKLVFERPNKFIFGDIGHEELVSIILTLSYTNTILYIPRPKIFTYYVVDRRDGYISRCTLNSNTKIIPPRFVTNMSRDSIMVIGVEIKHQFSISIG